MPIQRFAEPPLQGLKNAQPSPSGNDPSNPQSLTPSGSDVASYRGPEEGPFQCGNCQYFTPQSSCSNPGVIQELGPGPDGNAQVDAAGMCNLFEGLNSGGQQQGALDVSSLRPPR